MRRVALMLVSLDHMNDILSEDIVCVLCLRIFLDSNAESSEIVQNGPVAFFLKSNRIVQGN